ncbi:MAG TPA: transcriptional regulator [Microcoleaceae bacterium UBA11344]|jgi:Uma2 family endonuclease|nr:transcriptional regulator [Microcoleaceae cyanobacterium UBA11344]
MTFTAAPKLSLTLPDHTQLPDSDGTFVKNLQEHPQSILLTDSIKPVLQQLHPDGQYCIGQDSGIYWRLTEPLERGAEAPDWFYVPNVPPALNGQMRRSYVLWQEYVAPLIILEFVSGDGSEERDNTPLSSSDNEGDRKAGKFWIYEQVIRPAFYGIYEVEKASIELYHLVENGFELLAANERGHYPISQMGVELGIWQGEYLNVELPWLRWWDLQGNLLLIGEERAERERQRGDRLAAQSERERQRGDRLAAQLRSLGIEPEA